MADFPASDTAAVGAAAVTNEVFLADRQAFWKFFTGLVGTGLAIVVALLILMAYFLL